MADVAFDLLGDASIHSTPSRDTNNNLLAHNGAGAVLKDEEDAFSAAVTVWRGIFLKSAQRCLPAKRTSNRAEQIEVEGYLTLGIHY